MQPCHEINLNKNAGKVDTYSLALGFSIDDWLLKGGGWGHTGAIRYLYTYKSTHGALRDGELKVCLVTWVVPLRLPFMLKFWLICPHVACIYQLLLIAADCLFSTKHQLL